MTLKEKLDEYKQGFLKKVTPETLAIVQRCGGELQASIADRDIPQVGQSLPDFQLLGSQGQTVSSKHLLESGPLVVTFFRGMW